MTEQSLLQRHPSEVERPNPKVDQGEGGVPRVEGDVGEDPEDPGPSDQVPVNHLLREVPRLSSKPPEVQIRNPRRQRDIQYLLTVPDRDETRRPK